MTARRNKRRSGSVRSDIPSTVSSPRLEVIGRGRTKVSYLRLPARSFWLVAGALLALVAAIYGQTIGHAFINYDDGPYIVNNPAVNGGLTLYGLSRAFSFMATNCHPVTWFSHMLDVQIFGLHAWGHHMVNVLLHAGNAILLLYVLKTMTGSLWRSALVAALFAAHPLNVESVAWVAQRKSVLSTLFFWFTLASWLHWLRRPSQSRYIATLVLYSLGLMAKPILVTLPFVLLLLDWWPLDRFSGKESLSSRWAIAAKLLREKMPFFLLAGADSVLTWLAQLSDQTIVWVTPSLPTRVWNAVVSYSAYLVQAMWPARLAALYPYPVAGIPLQLIAGSAVLLMGCSILVWRWRSKRPFLAVGWCWYLGTLVPMIGLVQVGAQSRADRYAYLPLVGIFILLAWLGGDIAKQRKSLQVGLTAASLIMLVALSASSYLQTSYWRDSETLNEHSARVTKDNYIVLNNLGSALLETGRLEDAKAALQEALRIKPDHVNALINLGKIFQDQGRELEAVEFSLRALRLEPDNLRAHFNYGYSLFKLGRYAESLEHFEIVKSIDPAFLNVSVMVGMARVMRDRASAAQSSVPAGADKPR